MRGFAFVYASLFVFPLLAGCSIPSGTDDGSDGKHTNIDTGNRTVPDPSKGLLPGKHLNVTLQTATLAEGKEVQLLFANPGNETLSGSLVVKLLDLNEDPIAQTVQSVAELKPRGQIQFLWRLPAKLESGVYAWNATLDGTFAETRAAVVGTAPPGEGPAPIGVTRDRRLAIHLDKVTYFRGEPILVELENLGNVVARAPVEVSVHRAPEGGIPDDPKTVPAIETRTIAEPNLAPGANLTLPAFTLAPSLIDGEIPEFFVLMSWRFGTGVANFFVENRTEKPLANPGPLFRGWQPGPLADMSGNESINVVGDDGKAFQIYFHYAKASDTRYPADYQPDAAYRTTIKNAFTAAWDTFKAQGFATPKLPIHAYVDQPSGDALGTAQPTEYGVHIIIGPFLLHDQKKADVRTTVAHELFHAFQVAYDFDEGMIVEGYATWIMDAPFGSKEYLGQARAWLNGPDSKSIHFQEHEAVLFLRWLAETEGYRTSSTTIPEKLKLLTTMSADYDNEALFAKVFGKTLDALWIEFVTAVAERDFEHRADLFETSGIFGIKAWDWTYDHVDQPTMTLANDKANHRLRLPITNFEAYMIDEDVGQVKHAQGLDVYRLQAATRSGADDNVKITFQPVDLETQFTVLLARKSGTGFTVQQVAMNAEVAANDLSGVETYLFVTRGAAGKGTYNIVVAKA